ncbi:MAG: alpha-L-fucosidase [Oscillospiraceae bacterium]|nr:alpha-L-fucosidase [Oscillospiraceae bacterium]
MDKKDYLKKIDETIRNGKYKDNWDSLKNIPVPSWYKNSKFGIFIHYGVYSVPAYNNEWYPRNMYIEDSDEYNHHIETYGNHKDFGYKDFIPLFRAENFNADEWIDIFKSSGAKYVIPVAEHHDGFQMYKSEFSKFNAFDMGPKKDIIASLKESSEKSGIKFGVSSHRIEHWFFMGHGKEFDSDVKEPLYEGDFYWPAMEEPKDHRDLYSSIPSKEFLEDWLVRCCEIVDKFMPSIIYFDWWIQIATAKPYLKKFLAYYFNRANECGFDGIISYKNDGLVFGSGIVDMERGQFKDAKHYFWQSDTSTARNSWCYTKNNIYKNSNEILINLIDIVSKNGCMLLNVGPKSDGTITDEDKKILSEIGEWLKINGEAIYDSTPFRVYGEGPTEISEGFFTESEVNYTHEDIRFTQNGSNLYAIVLNYPLDGNVKIKSLSFKSHDFHGLIKDVEVLGFEEKPVFERDDECLNITTKDVKSKKPVVFKIKID